MAISSRTKGVFEILVSGIAFGFLGVFGKTAYRQGITPGELLSFRFLIAAATIATALVATQPRKLLLPIRTIVACATLGILGYAVFASCFFEALATLSASLTVLLLYTYPALVSLAAWVLFRQKPSALGWLSLPIVLVGMIFLVWGDLRISGGAGILFGLGSSLFYSMYILASSRFLRGSDPLVSVMYIQAFAGIALAAIHFRDPHRLIHLLATSWPSLLGIAWISTVLAMALFISGLQKLRPSEASVLSTAEPITGVLAAVLFLDERLVPIQIVGAVLVLAAMILITRPNAPSSVELLENIS